MSRAQQLQVLDNDINVPGCTFSRTALKIGVIDEDTLIHAGTFLAQVEGCRAWWWGDYLLAYCAFRLEQEDKPLRDEAKRDPKMCQRLYRRYTAERSDVARVDIDTLHEWRNVCDFYEMPRRRGDLSNEHHREAMYAAEGDAAIADQWLESAIENKWTVPQMRAAIRRSKQTESEPDEPLPEMHQQELFACARWSRAAIRRVPTMDTGEARQLLADLQPILALAAQLAAHVGADVKFTNAAVSNVKFTTATPGKESISPAA